MSGDLMMLTVAETGGNAFADPCVELYHPDLTVDSNCDSNNANIDLTLPETGIYNVVVSDGNNDTTLTYNITAQCIGSCDAFTLQCSDRIFMDGFE